jgi:hypothetical protein
MQGELPHFGFPLRLLKRVRVSYLGKFVRTAILVKSSFLQQQRQKNVGREGRPPTLAANAIFIVYRCIVFSSVGRLARLFNAVVEITFCPLP